MGSRSSSPADKRRRLAPRRWLVCISVPALVGIGVRSGAAAQLGTVTSSGLLSVSQAASTGSPSILGCDNFTGTNGASISGRAATVATACASRTWAVHVGTWTIQTNTAASSATADAVATENTATANCTVTAVITNLNSGGRSGGVVLSHNGTSTYVAAVMIDGTPDRIELRLYTAGVSTLLATYNPTFATTNTLQLSRNAAVVTTTLNGATAGTFTLTTAQLTTLGTGARAGLFGGNNSVRYDDFVVTAP